RSRIDLPVFRNLGHETLTQPDIVCTAGQCRSIYIVKIPANRPTSATPPTELQQCPSGFEILSRIDCGVGQPHSGQFPGLARRSYPQEGHSPRRSRRRGSICQLRDLKKKERTRRPETSNHKSTNRTLISKTEFDRVAALRRQPTQAMQRI